ncbi:MAG: GNAT family N-acetyltransferase, partial [Chloroflexi bacterium]|nr:GNAT family N-acetyltransferase [Chloroflexota bacterium]
MTSMGRDGRGTGELTYRPARPDELGACVGIWRVSINDYIVPLGQHEIPTDSNQVTRLFTHLQSTDAERFVVATTPDAAGERVVAFTAAVERERLWYLSMLFVLPELQGLGVGRELLARVLPTDGGMARSTATDSAQPISNALYATYGIVPRMPLLNLVGLPERPDAFGSLPSGITPVGFDRIAGGPAGTSMPGGGGHDGLIRLIEGLDREIVGLAHPQDHRFLRTEGRHGWLYCGPDGSPLAYGYAGESGRLGPIASRDPDLLVPILGHLTSAVIPRGASAIWVGGEA